MNYSDINKIAKEAGLWVPAAGIPEGGALIKFFHAAYAAGADSEREAWQHPVAWRTFDGEGGYDYRSYYDNEDYHQEYVKRNGIKYANWVEPLYTAPPRTIERANGIGV